MSAPVRITSTGIAAPSLPDASRAKASSRNAVPGVPGGTVSVKVALAGVAAGCTWT